MVTIIHLTHGNLLDKLTLLLQYMQQAVIYTILKAKKRKFIDSQAFNFQNPCGMRFFILFFMGGACLCHAHLRCNTRQKVVQSLTVSVAMK